MFDTIVNANEFLSDHWLSEAYPAKLTALTKDWTARDGAGESTPNRALASIATAYAAALLDLPAPRDASYAADLTAAHSRLLTAMGFHPDPQVLHTAAGGTDVDVPLLMRAQVNGADLLHVLQARPVDSDDELLADDAQLAEPIVEDPAKDRPKRIRTPAKAISLAFLTDDAPRFVLVVAGNQVLLTDAERWGEGRYLAFDVATALARRDTKATGELAWHAGLWSADVLLPPDTGEAAMMAAFTEDSVKHAVGVSEDLREGLRISVELIANEVLAKRREAGLPVEGIDELPGEITAQTLRFLYRILFLLFAEARPELGILPVGAREYEEGYGIDRLRELVQVPLSPQAARGSHFHDSLDLLFRLVNDGHGAAGGGDAAAAGHAAATDAEAGDPPNGTAAAGTTAGADDGLVFEALRADLFSPATVPYIDSIRLSNGVLQQVLELLLLSKKPTGKGKQRGFVSYAQLGINQLGAVYEGLMAYTGFIAERDLVELAKDGNPAKGTWMVPPEAVDEFDAKHLVTRPDPATGAPAKVLHPAGSFVYRLAGRDRQRSASYYTPEVLTRTVVKHALAELLTDDTPAQDILDLRVCEPALGSGAFLNEAINQLAADYLHRRQTELGTTIDPSDYQGELQKVKAFLALHRVYGVDLNATAVELAEVSMWLNVMHPGLRAPWFGLHLRRGNALVGARRAVYNLASSTTRKSWFKQPPIERPLSGEEGLGPKEVHHFLLPADGWGAAGDAKQAKELAKPQADALRAWAKGTRKALTNDEANRAVRLAQRTERLWALARRRLEISEYEIARTIDVWGRDHQQASGNVSREEVESALADPEGPYQRLRLAMDAWCAMFFWPVTPGEGEATLQFEPPRRDEWFEVLEGLLGVAEKKTAGDQMGLHELPKDFAELGQIDDQEMAWHGMKPVWQMMAETPWLAHVRDIARREGFFHWELDFAQVFADGGFDLQVGNPPWVRLDWSDDVTLSEFDPWFALLDKRSVRATVQRRGELVAGDRERSAYLDELASHAGLTSVLRSAVEHPVLEGLRTNLYMSFMERTWRNANAQRGVVGLLHPESHFSDPKAGALREATYRRLRRHWQFINEGRLFEDVHHQTEYAIHVYGSIQTPTFRQLANLLYPTTVDASLEHDGSGEPPGIKLPNGDWDLRPHRSRVVRVDETVLADWAALFDEPGTPGVRARLLRPVVEEQLEALSVLANYPTRMAQRGYWWTSGWNEKIAKDDGFIEWRTEARKDWPEVILQGPHFFVATPFFKQPNQPCTSNLDYTQWDLESLPDRVIPRTNYQRACDEATYRAGIPRWNGIPATNYWRLAWRNMTQPSSQRTLVSALVVPGASHVNTIHSLTVKDVRSMGADFHPSLLETTAVAGLWSSIPLDYLAKVGGLSHVQEEFVAKLPAPDLDHPTATPLLLRTLRLNCLTLDYDPLWQELFTDDFTADSWTSSFAHLPPLAPTSRTWVRDTPLRTDEARRAALVEIDALAALMLGLSADHLVSMYTGQMAVMRKYEYRMWFDANGRVIAQDNAAKGARQRDDDFKNLQAYLAGEDSGDLRDRYTPPFHQPDRVAEMRAAYAEFSERLGL